MRLAGLGVLLCLGCASAPREPKTERAFSVHDETDTSCSFTVEEWVSADGRIRIPRQTVTPTFCPARRD